MRDRWGVGGGREREEEGMVEEIGRSELETAAVGVPR
jgi:hypothetical protein